MASSPVNKQAVTNGHWGEKRALGILEKKFDNVRYMGDLIDYYAENGIPIEIKTCQFSIKSGNPSYPDRHGQFVLDKHQHQYLQCQNGYYLFLVKLESLLVKASLMKANNVMFTRKVTWTMLL